MENENSSTSVESTSQGTKVEMSLYEINRQLVAQLPEFGDSQWEGAEKVFSDWIINMKNDFFLLYGREINYFTLFRKTSNSDSSLIDAIKDCLAHIGPVHAFDIAQDKTAVEIWCECEGKMTCLYFFNYDEGIVDFHA